MVVKKMCAHRKIYQRKIPIPDNFEQISQLYSEEIVNAYEAADMLGISGNTFKRWIKRGIEVITESDNKKKELYYGDYRKDERLKLFDEYFYYVDSFMRFKYINDIPDKDDLRQELIISLWEFTADYLKEYSGEYFKGMLCVHLQHVLYHYREKLYSSTRNINCTFSIDASINNEEDNYFYEKYYSSSYDGISDITMKIFLEEWFEAANLTEREKQAVYANLTGYTNRDAAKIFQCGKSTIQYAWTNAKEKLKEAYLNW